MAKTSDLLVRFFSLGDLDQVNFLVDLAQVDDKLDGHDLIAYLLASSSKTAKVLGESLQVLRSDLPEELAQKRETLTEHLQELRQYVDNGWSNERAVKVAQVSQSAKPEDLTAAIEKCLSQFDALMKDAQESTEATEQDIRAIDGHNVNKASAYLIAQFTRSKSGASSNGDMPEFQYGQAYHVEGWGQQFILTLTSESEWAIKDADGKTVATSKKHKTVNPASWTSIGRMIRVLADDFAHEKDGWTITRGDLSSPNLSKVNAGGTRSISVKVFSEETETETKE